MAPVRGLPPRLIGQARGGLRTSGQAVLEDSVRGSSPLISPLREAVKAASAGETLDRDDASAATWA